MKLNMVAGVTRPRLALALDRLRSEALNNQ
jgi:hypothetical protein